MTIYIQLIIACFLWGSNIIVMKLLLQDIPFLQLATLRVLASFVFLGLYMKMKNHSFEIKHLFKVIGIGFLSIYLNFFFTFLGMNEVKGIDNAFMNALSPTLTLVLACVLLHDKPTKKECLSVILTLFAFLLSIRFRIFDIQRGFFYLFLGLTLYILGNVLMQKWQLAHTLAFSFYQLLFGFLFLCIHCLYLQSFNMTLLYDVTWWQWLLFIVISGMGFAYIQAIYLKAIGEIGAFQTSFYLSLNPIVTYIGSLFFLNESFDIIHCVSFVLLGIAMIIAKKKKET